MPHVYKRKKRIEQRRSYVAKLMDSPRICVIGALDKNIQLPNCKTITPNRSTVEQLVNQTNGNEVIIIGSLIPQFCAEDSKKKRELLVALSKKNEFPTKRIIYIANPEDNLHLREILALGENIYILHEADVDQKRLQNILRFRSRSAIIVNGKTEEERENIEKEDLVRTMEEFSESYDLHQRQTRHYAVMHAIITNFAPYIGSKLIDLGCGSAQPLSYLIADVFIPEIASESRSEIEIVGVDREVKMLRNAKNKIRSILSRCPEEVCSKIKIRLEQKDITEFNEDSDTIIATYVVHWLQDKRAFVEQIFDMLHPGGIFITIEEWPLVISDSNYMTPELQEKIRTCTTPIYLEEYYSLLQEARLKPINPSKIELAIDDNHSMYGMAFRKD